MLIFGAKGFAKEVLEILHVNGLPKRLAFYDDVTPGLPNLLYDQFPILRNEGQCRDWLSKIPEFCIGTGQPAVREMFFSRGRDWGGRPVSIISRDARVGHYDNQIGEGVVICAGVNLTNSVTIGEGALINLNCTIGHDSVIGPYTELNPLVAVSGGVVTGRCCSIGTGATLLPKIVLGDKVIVGAGAVVTKSVNAGLTLVGVPARPLGQIESK